MDAPSAQSSKKKVDKRKQDDKKKQDNTVEQDNKGKETTDQAVEPSSQDLLMERMLNSCFFQNVGCPICADFKKKIGIKTDPVADATAKMELEQSNAAKKALRLCLLSYNLQSNVGSMISSTDMSVIMMQETELGANAGGFKSILMKAQDCVRASMVESEPHGAGLEMNVSLCYGLHSLIKEVENTKNHRAVFDRLSQMQLSSLLAQVTCKETLWKETDGDARLLRMEQELNDLLAKEDAARIMSDRQSTVGGATGSASKKSSQDQGGSH